MNKTNSMNSGTHLSNVMVSAADAHVLNTIHEIVKRGNDVEIRRERDGALKVFEVNKKKIA